MQLQKKTSKNGENGRWDISYKNMHIKGVNVQFSLLSCANFIKVLYTSLRGASFIAHMKIHECKLGVLF